MKWVSLRATVVQQKRRVFEVGEKEMSRSLPFSRLFRQLEQEMETVVKVLQPGPLGIIEHKFSAEEIRKANATVQRAVETWRQNAILEQRNPLLKDYIHK
ncbi:hypothetical protein PRUPE_8G254700 [Prunus persica]|uniref:Uncharacterized protein n=4 Tax=Prunus TaxID=3754 RepID=M5VUV1_PRUPE|nr:uncharacterized protein LOC18768985 [Prunus persica]ONH93818.1 hypothetical protein PRUPE_8G254700 [Prunus persica]